MSYQFISIGRAQLMTQADVVALQNGRWRMLRGCNMVAGF